MIFIHCIFCISTPPFFKKYLVQIIFFYAYVSLKELVELGLGQYTSVSMFWLQHHPLSFAKNS